MFILDIGVQLEAGDSPFTVPAVIITRQQDI